MPDNAVLNDILTKDNWIEFGTALGEAADNPSSVGAFAPQDVYRMVADAKGKRSHSLANSVHASAWLRKTYPDTFRQNPRWLGMTLVLFLMKIHKADPKRGAELAPEVFSGQMGQVELKKAYNEVKAAKAKNGDVNIISAVSPATRSLAFEIRAREYLTEHGAEDLGMAEHVVKHGRNIGPNGVSCLVEDLSGRKVAVDIKGSRDRVDVSLMMNIIGRMSLLQRLIPEVLLIVPEESGYELTKLCDLRDQFQLEGISFASLPEQGPLSESSLKITA